MVLQAEALQVSTTDDAVRRPAGGHLVFSPSAAQRLVTASDDLLDARARARARLTGLTARELEALACLGLRRTRAAGRRHPFSAPSRTPRMKWRWKNR